MRREFVTILPGERIPMRYHVILASMFLTFGFVPPTIEKVKLEFKHKEESSATTTTVSKVHQILSIAGQDLETRANNNVTLTTTVGKRGTDGRLPIQLRIDALAVQLSLPMGINLEFDSSSPAAQNDNPRLQALLDTYKARVGSTHTIILGRNNEVLAVEGAEKVLENATPAAAEILRADINPEQIKKTAQQGYNILPNEPVGKGDTWTRTTSSRIGGGQILTYEIKYEYLGTEKKNGQELDRIGTTATSVTLAMDEKAQTSLKVTQSALKVDSSKGTLLFNRAKGQTMESNSTTHIVGDLTLSVNGMEFPGTLDLTLDSTSAVQK
jgi:hypothetical protein